MSLNSGRSPQITSNTLMEWIGVNYIAYQDPSLVTNTFPSPASDGQLIFYTVNNQYYQYDASLSNWVSLGPNYTNGFSLGNLQRAVVSYSFMTRNRNMLPIFFKFTSIVRLFLRLF